jgi:hypothetical protein
VVVKLVAEYLQEAIKFDRMAAEATDPKLKQASRIRQQHIGSSLTDGRLNSNCPQ